MDKKAAIELSVNFIVIIVLSVVIFAGGLVLAQRMFAGAERVLEDLDKQSVQRIENLLDDGSRVAMPFKSQKVANGESITYGVGILNVEAEADFWIKVTLSGTFDESGDPLLGCENPLPAICIDEKEAWLIYSKFEHVLRKNQKEVYMIHVTPENAAFGTYIFDVEICYVPPSGPVAGICGGQSGRTSYDPKRKILVRVI